MSSSPLQTYIPQAPLGRYVHMLWYWQGYHPPHPKERILPCGTMELVINLADERLCLYYPDEGYQPRSFYGPIVAGARSRFFLVDTVRPASILAVWFKPGAAQPFFNVSARDLHNLHVPLEALWGAQAAFDLYHQLLEAPTAAARFHLLEAALCARLANAAERHHAVEYALSAFSVVPHDYSVSRVVEQIALSPTRFIQVFSEDIGLTPKLFCRVQRFQAAVQRIARRQSTSWAEVAAACGYFDQAHLINEFQALAGITPTLYFPQSAEHQNNLAFFDES